MPPQPRVDHKHVARLRLYPRAQSTAVVVAAAAVAAATSSPPRAAAAATIAAATASPLGHQCVGGAQVPHLAAGALQVPRAIVPAGAGWHTHRWASMHRYHAPRQALSRQGCDVVGGPSRACLMSRAAHFCHVPACSTASVCSGLPGSGSRPATRPKKTHTALACATASRADGADDARAARDGAKHAGSSASGIVARNASSCAVPPDGCTTNEAYQRSSSASARRRRLRGARRPSTSSASRFIPFSHVHVPATIFGAASKALQSCTSGSAHHPPALEGESAPRSTTSWCLSYRRRKWAAVGGVCSSHSGAVDAIPTRACKNALSMPDPTPSPAAMRRAHVVLGSARAAGGPVKQDQHGIRSGREPQEPDPGSHVGTAVRPLGFDLRTQPEEPLGFDPTTHWGSTTRRPTGTRRIAQRRHVHVPATNGRATNCKAAARRAVYIYDWTTLTTAVHAVFGPEAEPNWRLYQLWASQASSLRVHFARIEGKPPNSNVHSRQRGGGPRPSGSTLRGLNTTNPVHLASWPFAQTEDPAFLVQGHLRRALAASEKRGVVKIVGEPGLADVIVWAVWDFAFCRAFNFHPLNFQRVRGMLPHSCPAHWKLLQWLTQTPVWKSSGGDEALRCTPRHIILGTHLHETRLPDIKSFRWRQMHGWPQKPTKADFFDWHEMQPVVDAAKALNKQASWIILENRQRRTTTRSIIAPYYSQCVLPYAVTSGSRSHLMFFAGATQKRRIFCAACENGISPRAIREKLVDDMLTHCSEACEVLAIRSVNAAGLGTQPAIYQTGMANATFCPVPRGDSATSKRLYDCILQASIPVLISDHFPLPFQDVINYRAGMLFFRESEFMLPSFSLTEKLRNLSQHKVAVLQAGVICLRDLLSYVSHPDDCPEAAPCSSMGWLNLLIATIVDVL